MDNIDEFANSLFEEAKRFLEKSIEAEKTSDNAGRRAYLHAALMLSISSLEAYVNAVADEVVTTRTLPLHQKAFLLEKDVDLNGGRFKISNRLKMSRLEDRLMMLHAIGVKSPKESKSTRRQKLGAALDKRNELTHPKNVQNLSQKDVQIALEAVVESVDALYRAVFNKPFPKSSRGLQSILVF